MLTTLAVSGYRSLRNLIVPLERLNLITGANGTGKSSLYRALRLLADTAQGRLVASLAREGGLRSTLWAGPETPSRAVQRGDFALEGTTRTAPIALRLGFAGNEFGYAIDLGLPVQARGSPSAFRHDPHVKREAIWHGPSLRPASLLVDRKGPVVRVRSASAEWRTAAMSISPFDSMMTELANPSDAPEILALRESIRAWRFYDSFRTDTEAPARRGQIGTYTPVLADDGADLAAAIQTIRELGDGDALDATIQDAFPGSELSVQDNDGNFVLLIRQPGLLRSFTTAELSDGTLRYLLLTAALLTPRPPELMVLNEPETSLHPDLLSPLARLIGCAARNTQVVVVSHSVPLIAALRQEAGAQSIMLARQFGETVIENSEDIAYRGWQWPSRA